MKFKLFVLMLGMTLMQSCGNQLSKTSEEVLNGHWEATQIKGNAISDKVTPPTLDIDIEDHKISGNDSCNGYIGAIQKITDKDFLLGGVAGTLMYCEHIEVADAFNQALKEVATYKVEEGELHLFSQQGEKLLSFKKNDKQ